MNHIAAILILAVALLVSCKPPVPPAAKPAADTLVILQGGLGQDRTANLATAIRARCPRALVITLASWDAYKVDPCPVIAANPKPKRVIIRHSYAAWWVTESFPVWDYDAELDPVNPGGAPGLTWWGNLPAPKDAFRVEVFWRTSIIGPRVARMPGVVPIAGKGGHNDFMDSAAVTDRIINTINAM